MLVLVAVAGPLVLVALWVEHIVFRRRLARLQSGATDYGHMQSMAFDDGVLTLQTTARGRQTVTFQPVTRIGVTVLNGDGGYADSNTITYLVVATTDRGPNASFFLCDSHPFQDGKDWFDHARKAGVLSDEGTLEMSRVHAGGAGCLIVIGGLSSFIWLLVASRMISS